MSDYDNICECGTRKGDHALEPPHRGTRTFCNKFTTPVPTHDLIIQLVNGVQRTREVLDSGSTGAWQDHIDGMRQLITKIYERGITQLMEPQNKP